MHVKADTMSYEIYQPTNHLPTHSFISYNKIEFKQMEYNAMKWGGNTTKCREYPDYCNLLLNFNSSDNVNILSSSNWQFILLDCLQ